MKMATGGKCKTCHNMYIGFRRLTLSAMADENEEAKDFNTEKDKNRIHSSEKIEDEEKKEPNKK
jgi:hypothetical protein